MNTLAASIGELICHALDRLQSRRHQEVREGAYSRPHEADRWIGQKHVRRLDLIGALAALVIASQTAFADPIDRTEIANAFWRDVWQASNPAAIENYVVEDFVITTGGKAIKSREKFKAWVADFQSHVSDLKLEVPETFPSADGTRTVSRLRLTGGNNGMMGLPPDGKPFTLTATAILAFREDGKILHNWVERNAWEI